MKTKFKTVIVGISGRSGSGKTTVVKNLIKIFGKDRISYVHQDSYYLDQSHVAYEKRGKINFDHPNTIEISLFIEHLKRLSEGFPINKPIYNYVTHTRDNDFDVIRPKEIILADGIHILNIEKIREILDLKVFVDTEIDICFIRRLLRDTKERGRSVEGVINQYIETVRPMQEEFVSPSIKNADFIIKDGGYNLQSIQQVSEIIIEKLNNNA